MIVEYALNRALPTEISDLFRRLHIGTLLQGLLKTRTEARTVTADVATLSGYPASIVAVTVTAGGGTGRKEPVPAGTVPGAGEYVLDQANHTITFAAADAATTCSVEYHMLPDETDDLDDEWVSRP